MTLFQAIVLGVVQGLAEFLPVSSSAHLTLVPFFFGWKDPGLAFDVALHFGTLVALVWYFRDEWIELIKSGVRILQTRRIESVRERRVLYLIVATIPGGIAGKLLNDYAESTFRSPLLIACTLTIMGVLLWAADRFAAPARALDEITMRDAVLVGFAQCLALIPGVSRSGSTITAGRALQLDRPSAARFSFLMSMPITAAAVAIKLPEAIRVAGLSTPLIAGIVAAFISSWLAITVLMRYISRHSFGVFALYRIMLAAAVVATVFARR